MLYIQIGTIHSPFREPGGTPIQPMAAKGIGGSVEVFDHYNEGLKDIDGFSHLILLYHFHLLSAERPLVVKPFLDERSHGVFATRAPGRPNPIGISVVRLIRVVGNILHVKDLDILDGTPLLDIKPYISEFDVTEVTKKGWIEKNIGKLAFTKDDGRFSK